jgi:hypothetical protein
MNSLGGFKNEKIKLNDSPNQEPKLARLDGPLNMPHISFMRSGSSRLSITARADSSGNPGLRSAERRGMMRVISCPDCYAVTARVCRIALYITALRITSH